VDENGRAVLESAQVHLADSPALLVDVEETDDMGIWIRIDREDGKHLVLVRWDYILSVDFLETVQSIGLRP
jgi:hypothetical protein